MKLVERARAALAGSVPPVAVAGLVWLALFAILYTAGDAVGAWPKLPVGRLQNLELFAGFAAGAALLAHLLISPKRRSERSGN